MLQIFNCQNIENYINESYPNNVTDMTLLSPKRMDEKAHKLFCIEYSTSYNRNCNIKLKIFMSNTQRHFANHDNFKKPFQIQPPEILCGWQNTSKNAMQLHSSWEVFHLYMMMANLDHVPCTWWHVPCTWWHIHAISWYIIFAFNGWILSIYNNVLLPRYMYFPI